MFIKMLLKYCKVELTVAFSHLEIISFTKYVFKDIVL